ncbi:hypothetical protein [Nocardiopsis potens]|uniref:hypothetical protein n=1 Tax=Nocardiopsis potens TaxID=1246458 RepID=UPI001268BEB3|nr:hypothetical protein [Nocardiopsis potens]
MARMRPFTGMAAVLLAALIAMAVPGAPAALADGPGEARTPAAFFAERLAEDRPGSAVYVSDALAGAYDTEALDAELHGVFDPLDVPYYVVAAPPAHSYAETGAPVSALMDRVGEDGVYVLISPGTAMVEAAAKGVDLPAEEAARQLLYSTDLGSDPSIDDTARAFAEALTDPAVAERGADTGASPPDDGEPWDFLPSDLNPGRETPAANLGLLCGMLGSAAGILLLAAVVRRSLRDGGPSAGKSGGNGKKGGAARRPLPLRAAWVLAGAPLMVLAALAAAALPVAGGAALTVAVGNDMDAYEAEQAEQAAGSGGVRRSEDESFRPEPPYVRDTVRVERIAAGLEESRFYLDPLASSALPPEEAEELAERAAGADVPVRVAVVAMDGADESGGDPEILAHALHSVLGDDAVYIVAAAGQSGYGVTAVPFGAGPSEYDIREGMSREQEKEDPGTAQVIGAALSTVEQGDPDGWKTYPVPEPYLPEPPEPADRPYLGDYFGGEGVIPGSAVMGPLLAAALGAAWWALRRFGPLLPLRLPMPGTAGSAARAGADLGDPDAPRRPGRSALNRMFDRECAELKQAVEEAGEGHRRYPEAMSALDAALLLADEEHDELDLVGLVVLLRTARGRLRGLASADRPVCGINPLHGPAQGRRGGRDGRLSAFCPACAALTSAERAERVLLVRAGGRAVPHTEVDRFWTATGYGADGTDLAGEVRARLGVR